MRVGLFIPCYMDAFEPEVGIATLELLERLGCAVQYPVDQTCCGQPMTKSEMMKVLDYVLARPALYPCGAGRRG
jgi:Fe-S oxidoreductase